MAQADFVVPLVLTFVDGTEMADDTWTAFDTDGIEGACFMIRITNDTDSNVGISYDGVESHECIPANGTIEVNFQTNSSPSGYVSKLKKGTVLYVQGDVAQAGNIYLAGYYNET